MANQEKTRDPRVSATIGIWICATFMVFFSIVPVFGAADNNQLIGLVDASNGLIFLFLLLPVVILLAAGAGTAAVWTVAKRSIAALPQEELNQLEQRLGNLETIISYEEPALRMKIEQLKSQIDSTN